MLDELRPAGGQLPRRQRAQGRDIGQDEAGLVKGANDVLGLRVVHRHLAPDGRVHHRQQAGGDVDQGEAADVSGGDVARQVSDHAAAQGHHRVAALRPPPDEPVVDGGGRVQRLADLARRNGVGGDGDIGLGQSGLDLPAVAGEDGLIADDVGLGGEVGLPQAQAEVEQSVPVHVHRIGGRGGAHHAGGARGGRVARSGRHRRANEGLEAVRVGQGRCGVATPGANHLLGDEIECQAVGVDGMVGQGIEGLTPALQLSDTGDGVWASQEWAIQGLVGLSALAETAQDRLRARLQTDDEAAVGQEAAVVRAEDGAAADGDDGPLAGAGLADGGRLQFAEAGLAVLLEDVGDRFAGGLLDEGVGVNDLPAQSLGDDGGDEGLAGAGEAGEDDAEGAFHRRLHTPFEVLTPGARKERLNPNINQGSVCWSRNDEVGAWRVGTKAKDMNRNSIKTSPQVSLPRFHFVVVFASGQMVVDDDGLVLGSEPLRLLQGHVLDGRLLGMREPIVRIQEDDSAARGFV